MYVYMSRNHNSNQLGVKNTVNDEIMPKIFFCRKYIHNDFYILSEIIMFQIEIDPWFFNQKLR